ncbi:MAG: hypothetical protein FJX76_15325 [Armatimonadetes bacterium]|nr:hypothetical protein [Armatimonadota bacterium]
MVATRESRPRFGPDENTLRIKRWLDEDLVRRRALHDWMQAHGLEKQALTTLLYGGDRGLMREQAASELIDP